MDGTKLPDAIKWHEGMLLAPQHFQQADLRMEGLVHYHVGTAAPYLSGLRRLSIDQRALSSGVYSVLDLEAVLPDGTLVTEVGQVDLKPHAKELEGRGILTIHLAVPARRKTGEPVEGGGDRMVDAVAEMVTDHGGEAQPIRVPRVRPNARLVVADSAPDKYSAIPIAKVEVQQDNFAITDYAPPVLEVSATGYPADEVSNLVREIREKSKYLADKIRATSATAKTAKAAELQRTVEILFGALPPVEALMGGRGVHPFPLYVAVTGLAGRLAGLTPGVIPGEFPRYDHDGLRATFDPVLSFCRRQVESVEQAYEVLTFRFDGADFRLPLRPEWEAPTLILGAVGGSALTRAGVTAWMKEVRIGTVDHMRSIADRRVRGADRLPVESVESIGLVPSSGVQLFRVNASPDVVTPGRELILSHPGQRQGREQPAEIVLYAPNTGAA